MTNKIKLLFLTVLIVSFSSISYSQENYCLDEEGLILPLFDTKNCLNSNDIKIDQNEFSYIIEHDPSIRLSKLEYFRANPDVVEEINKDNLLLSKTKDKKDLTPSEKRKIDLKQKKIARLAKELERKELIKAKKEKRLLEQRKKRAELRKKAQIKKKEAQQKKLKRIADREKKIAERKLKLEAKKKERKQKKLEKLAEKEKRNKQKKIAKLREQDHFIKVKDEEKKEIQKSINEELKLILVDNQIVNNQLFPKISGDFEVIEEGNLKKEYLDNLIEYNKNVLILIPKDYETTSVRVSENRMMSQIVIGIDQIPNPEINRIEAELRRAEQDYLIAERKFQIATAEATNYNPYGGWASVFNQWAGLAGQAQAGKARTNAKNRLESWSAKLSTTPMYLEKERLGSYNYDVVVIKSEKNSIYDILSFNNGNFYKKSLGINSVKNFNVAYGLNPQDKNYKKLQEKYSTEEEVSLWSNKKLKDITIENLKTKIRTSGEFEKLESKKIAYKFLGQDTSSDSFWSKLFGLGPKKDKKVKTASLTKKSSYETKDIRFDSVVVVKTNSGMGSGFFISEDEIITNYHVVEDSLSISIIDKNKRKSSAVIIKKDLKRDLALLKTNMKGKPVIFYDGKLKQGEMVEALGHPKGRKFSLTKGWISAIRKESSTYSVSELGDVLFIQTDAAINPGNSGGPLFYKDKVVGVNTQGLHKDSTEGMNFAVHFSEVNQFLTN